MKKTIKVEELKVQVNQILSSYDSRVCSKEYLEGMRSLLESVLHQTGNYCGYQYLDRNQVPFNELPGARFEYIGGNIERYVEDGPDNKVIDLAFENTDSNRVRYY